MRILNISVQKPDSTGSGVYLAEMVRCELSAGHAAAVVAGVDEPVKEDLPAFESRLADALERAVREGRPAEQFDVSALSWESLVSRVTCAFEAL